MIQVNEEEVEIVHTFNPASESVEEFLYPRPGNSNATSVLKLLVLRFSESREAS